MLAYEYRRRPGLRRLAGLRRDPSAGFVKRARSGSGSQREEDLASGAAGPQHAGSTFPTWTSWFMVCALFRPV